MDWRERLTALFLYVNKYYESELFMYSERMNDNSSPELSDAGMTAVYLRGIRTDTEK